MRISDWSSDVCSSDLDKGGAADHDDAASSVSNCYHHDGGHRRLAPGRILPLLQYHFPHQLPVWHEVEPAVGGAWLWAGTCFWRHPALLGHHLHRRDHRHGRRNSAGPDERRLSHPICKARRPRSEEHTSELQSLMRISSAVFCLKKKK